GSSDGAAVLRALNRLLEAKLSPERLEELGGTLGSDVPFCVRGGTQLAEGRGDELRILPQLPDCGIVICKPPFSVSTPELFRHVDERRGHNHPDTEGMISAIERGELRGVTQRLYNVFEDVPGRHRAAAAEIKSRMLDLGAMGTAMSGTGPSVFGVFEDMGQAERARRALSQRWRDCFAARPAAPEV
ncbi:MAG: 4-(cytidine 5'-diphospho)-2-C-methyl-D-erythritol kinase, partial [Butyricicoccus sp.]|nr:4-(cytidine 5'-diphospho)-2-C-methyl-D-erythritol kinase [Butyricicoccus sp.]